MPSVTPQTSLKAYQRFVEDVYGFPNDRHFDTNGMLTNLERFLMRGLKGIRKGDPEKTKLNLVISFSWMMSLLNQLHIDLEDEVWARFPAQCSYCASSPCACKVWKVKTRKTLRVEENKRPKTLAEFQEMFQKVYPPESRTLEHAGVHLAEEMGEFAEALMGYRSMREEREFAKVCKEAADLFSCLVGVFNSLGVSLAGELAEVFGKNCHACKKAPCECSFSFVMGFTS